MAGKNEKTIRQYVRNLLREDIETEQLGIREFTDPFASEPGAKDK